MNASPAELDTEDVDPTDLTLFQQEILYALAEDGRQKGLAVLETLRDRFGEPSMSHGRIYPNLDGLVDDGLVEKTEIDQRTNGYALTKAGKRLVRRDADRRWGIADTLTVRGEE